MKIYNNLHQTYIHTPSFGSLPICRGVVLKHLSNGTKKTIPVEIHLLRAEDIADIERVAPEWQRTTFLGRTITKCILKYAKQPTHYSVNRRGTNFFALKPVNAKDLGTTDPIALAIVTRYSDKPNNRDYVTLNYIQTAKNFKRHREKRTVSGCGEMLLYGIAQFMKNINYNLFHFKVFTTSRDFYTKLFRVKPIGFGESTFEIEPKIVNQFIERAEEKYKLPKGFKMPESTLKSIDENSYMTDCK